MVLSDAIQVHPERLNKMTAQELKTIGRTLFGAANKRIARIDKAGVYSPARAYIEEEKGIAKFTMGGDIKELRRKIKIAREFLSKETSTLAGAKAVRREVQKRIGADEPLTQVQEREFWRGYDRFARERPDLIARDGSEKWIKQTYAQTVERGVTDREDIFDVISRYADESDEFLDDFDDDIY